MTLKEFKEFLNTDLDFEFEYAGKNGTICLCENPIVYVIYGGIETETTYAKLLDELF